MADPAPGAQPAAPAAPAATPAVAPPPMRPASAPPPPEARAAVSAPANPPAAEPSSPFDQWGKSPQQLWEQQERQRAASDPLLDHSKPMLRDRSGRVVGPDGRLVDGGDTAPSAVPDSTPAEPAADKPKIRFGDDVTGWSEASEDQVRQWAAEHAAAESRRATLPQSPEGYEVKLPETFKAPEAFKDWRPDGNHALMGQLREFSHRAGLSQDQFSQLLGLHASQQIGSAMMLEKAARAEVEKLGTNGTLRVGAVQDYIRSVAGDELYEKTKALLATAAMVQVWERVMQRAGVTSGSSYSGSRSSPRTESISEADYQKLSYSEKKEYASRMSGGR
jgi:hypothetical protein